MSGYCAIGRPSIASAPPRVMMIEITDAKIGRSMQKWEIFVSPARSVRYGFVGLTLCQCLCIAVILDGCFGRRGRCRGDLQRHVSNDANRPVDHDLLAGLQTVVDEPAFAVPRAHFNHPLRSFRVAVQ